MSKRVAAALLLALMLAACSKTALKRGVQSEASTPKSNQTAPPSQPGERYRGALALIGDQKYREAEATLREVVAEEPGNADAWNDLSFVQAQQWRFSDAVVSAQTALRLRPDFVYAQYNLGWALLNGADWKKAREPLVASMNAQPDRPEPLYALGRWYEKNNSTHEAMSFYQRAAAMGHEPAKEAAASLANKQKRLAAADEAIVRFPQAPPDFIHAVMDNFDQEKSTRRVLQVLQVRFSDERTSDWVALVLDQTNEFTRAGIVVYSAQVGRLGEGESCGIGAKGSEFPVQAQVLPYTSGDHLMVQSPVGTVICGLKRSYVSSLFATKEAVAVSSDGLSVAGKSVRFVPEISQYLPASEARALQALISEVRAVGLPVQTMEAVTGQVNVTGKPALALAWAEETQNTGLVIAVKPDGEPAILYTAGRSEVYPWPHGIGQVTVPGHLFLAVATYQKDMPNGGDVLVLEYDQAKRTFRRVFQVRGHGANFGTQDVSTTYKRDLPSEHYLETQTYTWDEAKGAFVPGELVKSAMN